MWTKQKLAERLEMSPNLLQIGIVDKALEILQNSPLLKTGPFPRIPKRNPRKRDDYKCGTCGKKKRNHVCHNGGNGENDEGGYIQDVPMKKEDNEEDNYVNEEDEEEEGDYAPPSKKRKKVFKPLVVVMHFGESPALAQLLDQVSAFGEKNVEARLNPQYENEFEIYGEIIINGTVYVVGKISDGYKEIVKKSIEDGSLVKVELAQLQKIYNNQHIYWLVQFVLHRNSSWRTKKLNEYECMNRKDDQ